MTVLTHMTAIGAAILLLAACTGGGDDIRAPAADAENAAAEAAEATGFAPRPGEGRMTPDLERRIDALITSLETEGPTTLDNAEARALVIYDWANALALEGVWIHPQLPALVAVITQPNFVDLNPRMQAIWTPSVDNFIRELAIRRDNPDAFGTVAYRSLTRNVVDGYITVEAVHTVGSETLRPGGGIVLPNHFRFADFEYQVEDPSAPNYVTLSSSRADVEFKVSTFIAAGQYAQNLRGEGSNRLFFEITAGELVEGDTVTVLFGDTRQGSPGLQTVHYSNTALRYPVWIQNAALEDGGVLSALPESEILLLGDSAAAVQGFGPAVLDIDEAAEITVRVEDKFRNRAETDLPETFRVTLNGEAWGEIDMGGAPIARFPVSFAEPGVKRFAFESTDGRIRGIADPILVEENPDMRIYWGETHGHSGWAEGLGLVDAYFEFARDEARLSFITLSEHDLWMDFGEWARMKEAVEAFDAPGAFITFMGYEYTVDPPFGGHHNVVFRKTDEALLAGRQYYPTIQHVYDVMNARADVEDVLIVPHAHMQADWRISDPGLEDLVEIVSYHGTFEWFGKRYLNQGWEVGFIGASDDHVGSPGYRPRALGRPGSDNFGGIAAAYAPELSRDAIFDALKSRNAYATNGARIILRASLNDTRMGQRVEPAATRSLSGTVIGTGPVASITLIKNGETFETIDYESAEASDVIEIGFKFDSDPRAIRRTLPDPTFRGRIDIAGAQINAVDTPVADALNSLTEGAELDEDGMGLTFSLRSGGRVNTLRLELDDADAPDARLTLDLSNSRFPRWEQTSLDPITIDLAAIADGPLILPIAGEDSYYRMFVRRIAPVSETDRRFEFTDTTAPEIGDYYFLRIRQADGGMAWSSPWWIGEPRRRPQPVTFRED